VVDDQQKINIKRKISSQETCIHADLDFYGKKQKD